jgi:hypothetical protein
MLLFLIFINDVADNMTGFGRLFADDTCIGHMAHNEENLHVSKALLISTKVILVICFVSNASKILSSSSIN